MPTIPAKAEALIVKYNLGTPKEVYKSHPLSSIIIGLFLTLFAVLWIIVALFITRSPLLPTNLQPFQPSALPMSTDSTFTTLLTTTGIVFPLFGLIFVVVGISIIISAFLNWHVQAVLCTYGVVYLERKGIDAFRWEQVATVLDKVSVHTHTTDHPDGSTDKSTRTSHTYTVACKDGRRFIFNRILSEVEQLGEEMQIAVALSRQSI